MALRVAQLKNATEDPFCLWFTDQSQSCQEPCRKSGLASHHPFDSRHQSPKEIPKMAGLVFYFPCGWQRPQFSYAWDIILLPASARNWLVSPSAIPILNSHRQQHVTLTGLALSQLNAKTGTACDTQVEPKKNLWFSENQLLLVVVERQTFLL